MQKARFPIITGEPGWLSFYYVRPVDDVPETSHLRTYGEFCPHACVAKNINSTTSSLDPMIRHPWDSCRILSIFNNFMISCHFRIFYRAVVLLSVGEVQQENMWRN